MDVAEDSSLVYSSVCSPAHWQLESELEAEVAGFSFDPFGKFGGGIVFIHQRVT